MNSEPCFERVYARSASTILQIAAVLHLEALATGYTEVIDFTAIGLMAAGAVYSPVAVNALAHRVDDALPMKTRQEDKTAYDNL